MTRTRALLLLILLAAAPLAAAGRDDCAEDRDDRIRITDVRLQAVLREGIIQSRTFRDLVARLNASNVVVYVEEDRHPRHGVDGRLTFVSSAAGMRYVLVRVAYLPDDFQQIAMLGHELRHAVEVADAPEVVDGASLEREYTRIGRETTMSTTQGRTFDTNNAVRAGYRILRELRNSD